MMMIILFVLIGFLIYTTLGQQKNVNSSTYENTQASTIAGAQEIAKVRLAKGELSIDEYEKIKNNLL